MKTEKYKRTEWGLITLAVLMPIIMLLGATFITGHGFRITSFIPTLADEVVWHSQISSMVEKGKILGYYGYNGSVAQVGGYGPWGYFTLLPYVLVGKLFGSHFYMMVLANILFLTIAVAVFLLLTKPNRRQLIMIILLQPSVYLILLYSSLSMAESLRFSFSIILAGIMVRLLNKRGGKILLYVIAPITLLFFSLCYMVNIIWIPIYLYCICDWKKKWKYASLSAVVVSIMAIGVNFVTTLYSCTYKEQSTIASIFSELHKGIYQGIYYFIHGFFKNIYSMNILQLLSGTNSDFGITTWVFIMYLAVVATVIYLIVKKKLERGETKYYNVGLYLLIITLFMYCGLYSGYRSTLARGICVGLIGALFMLSVGRNRKVFIIAFIIAILGSSSSYLFTNQSFNARIASNTKIESFESKRKFLEEKMQVNLEGDRWENTIACYAYSYNTMFQLPSGLALNLMPNYRKTCKAKWAIMRTDVGRSRKIIILDTLSTAGYREYCSTDDYIIYRR